MNRLRSLFCCCGAAALGVYSLSGGPSPVIGRPVPDHVSGSLRGGGFSFYKEYGCMSGCPFDGSNFFYPADDGRITGQCGPGKVKCGVDCVEMDSEVTPVET